MIQGFGAALSGLRAFMNGARVASNNLANLNTPGFKSSSAVNTSLPGGLGVRTSGTRTDQSQGAIITTGRGLDLAINGSGFFRVKTADGTTGFTRAGSFTQDNQGRLVDSNGNTLEPAVTIPGGAKNIAIGQDGAVTADVNGQRQTVGNIELVNFNNPGGLRRGGGNVFFETADSGQPVSGAPGSGGLGQIMSGALETSNVDIATEMVNLIQSETGFKTQIKTIQTADEMIGSVLDIRA